jgi:hypothetical protein
MKKLKLTLLILLIPFLVAAGPVQQKHLAVIAALNVAAPGGGEIALDATSESEGYGTSRTWSHTIAGDNRLLVVGVATRFSSGPTGVTWNGDTMTLLDEDGSILYTSLYYILSPDTGTHDIVASFSENMSCATGAISFTGVAQSSTFGTPVNNAATAETLSTTISGATNDWCVDVIAIRSGAAPTVIAGQTERANIAEGTAVSLGMSTEPGAASVTMGWTWTGSVQANITAVAIKPL